MVLQRWQTVYLLIAVIVMALAAYLPATVCQSCVYAVGGGMLAYYILNGVNALLLLVTIFKFKNLKLQKSLCAVAMLLMLGSYGVLTANCLWVEGTEVTWIALFPAFAFICTFLAKGRIVSDYNLLRDCERLR